MCVCVCIWKFLLKFDSGHAWTIFCGICKGLIAKILIGLCRCWFGIPNLNQLVLISKNWPNDPHFSCQTFVRVKSLDDFVDVEVDFKNQIEEEFEDHLDHYVQFVDMIDFDF